MADGRPDERGREGDATGLVGLDLNGERRVVGQFPKRAWRGQASVVLGAVIFSWSRWFVELPLFAKTGADEVQDFLLGHF